MPDVTSPARHLSLFSKWPSGTQVEGSGWSPATWNGIRVWRSQVDPGHAAPTALAHTVRNLSLVPIVQSRGAEDVQLAPWTTFIRDFVGFVPETHTGTTGSGDIIAPRLAIHGPGAILDDFTGLEVQQSTSNRGRHTFKIVENHPAISPLREGDQVEFNGGYEPLKIVECRALAVDDRGRTCIGVYESPKPRLRFGFDPITSLWDDARLDSGPGEAAINSNWLYPMLSGFVWSSPVAAWKGLWPADTPPLLYSVDTEAGAGYYDASEGVCNWARSHRLARHKQDMKTQYSVATSVTRLNRHGLVGTFCIDLNAVRDTEDRLAIAGLAAEHDVAYHLPAIGSHDAWAELLTDEDTLEACLREGFALLSAWIQRPPTGFRYPSWKRTPRTHDLVASLGLGYDSSSLTHPPYLSVPFRFPSSRSGAPLDLWEFPCLETIGAVKLPLGFGRARWKRRAPRSLVKQYLARCGERRTMAVLCDHDMALGAAPRHRHGTWRLDVRGQMGVLRAGRREVRLGNLQPMRGSDYLEWWEATRKGGFDVASGATDAGSDVRLAFRWRQFV